MKVVIQNMETIRSVFMDTGLYFSQHTDLDELINYLDKTDISFRSIAYESASMSIAINELKKGDELKNWIAFANGPAWKHRAQVHIGLGLAIAKLKIPFLSVLNDIDLKMFHRIADGCGYYDGVFQKNHTVTQKEIPAYFPLPAFQFYDQGIGRSLWYNCNAEIKEVKQMIKTFPLERQSGLWRGIGIAVAYIGGCSEKDLKLLWKSAANFNYELSAGAALAVKSRMGAGSMTADTDMCSKLWFMHAAFESEKDLNTTLVSKSEDFNLAYENWLNSTLFEMENAFRLASELDN